jgi:hypothetical protein
MGNQSCPLQKEKWKNMFRPLMLNFSVVGKYAEFFLD